LEDFNYRLVGIEAEDINDMTFEDGLFKNKEALRKFINWVVRQQWKALGTFEKSALKTV
jgi:hypothetical protein